MPVIICSTHIKFLGYHGRDFCICIVFINKTKNIQAIESVMLPRIYSYHEVFYRYHDVDLRYPEILGDDATATCQLLVFVLESDRSPLFKTLSRLVTPAVDGDICLKFRFFLL